MMYCNITQAMSVVLELEDARLGRNGFGGNVAEIYCHTINGHEPLSASIASDFGAESKKQHAYECAQTLNAIIRWFEEERDAFVEIEDGGGFREWNPNRHSTLYHRVHLRVIDRKRTPKRVGGEL